MATQLELEQRPFIELQIEALVEENRIKPNKVNKFIDELKARLLDEIEGLNYNKLLKRTFRLPIIGRPNALNEDYPKAFKFAPPQQVDVIGGFKTATALKRTHYVDIAICMPAQCFEKKDVKNQRYHHKRALYLAQLAHLLNGSAGLGLVENIEFRFHQGDFLKPVILLTPSPDKLKSKVVFQLFTYPEQDFAIKVSLLNPLHGNIAPKWFFKDYQFAKPDEELQQFIQNDSDVSSSPFYNSSILFDIELLSNSDLVSELIGSKNSISEALMLTKIWLFQRELHQHFSFIMSMFVAYIRSKQMIHQNMSSYQVFKVMIKLLCETDWVKDGLSYYEDSKDKISTFKSVFPVVFLAPSGNLNLCYNITIDLYGRLKHEATIAHDVFASCSPDTFEMLFLRKVDFINKFDVIVHLPKCTKKLPEKLDYVKKFMDHGAFVPRMYSNTLMDLAHKALTDRVILLQQSPDHLLLDKKWNLKGIPYDPTNQDHTFSFGLLLNAEKSLRIIDIGPDAQTAEAEEFRQFWEPKCQLRLQNGVISETVVWHVDSFSQRRAIIKYILTHAFKRANMNLIIVHYTLLERFLNLNNVFFRWRDDTSTENGSKKRPHGDEVEGTTVGVGEEVFQKVLHAYNELNKILRSVENLKHSITSIQPVSHHLRASGVFPPLPVSLQPRNKSLKRKRGVTLFPEDFDQVGKVLFIEPIEILLTLDSNSKWPNDSEALEAAKLDYLLQLGESLKSKDFSIKFSNNYLDVLQQQFVFRIRIKCQKEMTITTAAKGELQRKRLEFEISPRVHGALDQIYREKPAFSLTCRLVKRWIGCHLMTNHIGDMALDLIVAHLFLHPQPYTEPASSLCGLKRFLMLFSKHDWKELPLMVNFGSELKLYEINRIKNEMQNNRAKFPPLVICTPFDKETSPWTRPGPDETKLDLLSKICTKALQFLHKDILLKSHVIDECKALFRPNFKLFDLLIKLRPQVLQTFFMGVDPPEAFKMVGKETSEKRSSAFKVMPIVGLNVIEQFVDVLRDNFDDVAEFFYDRYGQRVIGVMMRPESEKILEGDINNFMKEIKKLGAKLIDSVSILKHE